MLNDVSTFFDISSPLQAENSMSKRSFRWRLCVKFLICPVFLFYSVFKPDFIRCVDFTRIAASNTASDDVTN